MANDFSWLYKLFFSVDLRKSTNFKSDIIKNGDWKGNAEWALCFENFYESFTESFVARIRKHDGVEEPSIWKCLGDEVIYAVDIADSSLTSVYVDEFAATIKNHNSLIEQKPTQQLQCQGTVWGAGFPVRNRIVKTPSPMSQSKSQKNNQDYIGLEMDLGFRISKFSKPEKLVISIQVAYFLSKHQYQNLKYYDYADIKGIDEPYPIFWISTSNKESTEHSWYKECDKESLESFFNNLFVPNTPAVFLEPFIHNDKSNMCAVVPEYMEKMRSSLKSGIDTEEKKLAKTSKDDYSESTFAFSGKTTPVSSLFSKEKLNKINDDLFNNDEEP